MPGNQSAATKTTFQFARGFLMGSADIVPGVSGGTVALILGIYKALISNVRLGATALKEFLTAQPSSGWGTLKSVDWMFLVPLGAGVATAFLVFRHPMEDLLRDHSEGTAAVFCGLVLASCALVWNALSDRSGANLGLMGITALAAFGLLGFQAGAVLDPPLWMFAVTGSIAICAMILPGISGSFIMLMFGMYGAVLGASVTQLAVFLLGASIGLGLFSSFLNWLLDRYEQRVLAALLGLMLGSFRVLWPWPNGVGFISDEADEAVNGTGLSWPEPRQLALGIILAAAAAAATLAIVRVAEDSNEEEGATA